MEINKKTLRNIFIGVLICIFAYWLVQDSGRVNFIVDLFKGMFSPFVIGAGLAFILNVPMRWFEKHLKWVKNFKLRRIVALLLTAICLLMVIALVFLLLIPELIDTIKTLGPKLYDFAIKAEEAFKAFVSKNPKVMNWISTSTDLDKLNIGSIVQNITGGVSKIVTGAFSAIGSITTGLVNLTISLVFAIYCLFQKEILARQGRRILYAFLPEKTADYLIRVLRLSSATFSNFLSGQCVEVVILGTMFAIAMAIFRFPYIPVVSVLVAITAFIPIVGAWVGCILGAFLILVANPVQALWFVLMFIILQQVENHLIYPKVVGTSIGLSGMWVLVAVSVGGAIFGVAGMFLMIPLASVAYTLFAEFTYKKLESKDIDPDKLMDHPADLRMRYKEKRARRKFMLTKKKTAENLTQDKKSDENG